jgi:hypothetical protein
MRLSGKVFQVCLLTLGLAAQASYGAAQQVFIAGTAPSLRPANAPIIAEFVKDAAWMARALPGVDEPYPDSLKFLADQGAWFTPFIHPGMLGVYDIRHWHENQ